MIHMQILFQQSRLLLLLKFILSAFYILGYLDIFMFRYFLFGFFHFVSPRLGFS